MKVVRLHMALIVLLVVGFVLQGASSAKAHTLKVDGQTGITLHIEPNDEPVSGEASKLLIGVQDKNGAFLRDASMCTCVIEIKKDDQTVDTIDFTADSEGNTTIDYTFISSGIHKINVRGQPTVGTGFEPFDVVFSYRVKGGANSTSSTSATEMKAENELQKYTPFVVMGAALFIVILFLAPSTKAKQAAKK